MIKANPKKRKSLSKNLRFEVFKRDSFKCQYCGAEAPDVLLVIDHINPVSKGGDNDLTNLITAFKDCNCGKTNRTLDDKSVVYKTRKQLEELQERREQLEMMMRWRQVLKDFKEKIVEELCFYWQELAPGYTVNENGIKNVKSLMRKYSHDEIVEAMDISAERYLERTQDGVVTNESWDIAFDKIGGICHNRKFQRENPHLAMLNHINNIAQKNCGYFNKSVATELLFKSHKLGATSDELMTIARGCRCWTQFYDDLESLMAHLQG